MGLIKKSLVVVAIFSIGPLVGLASNELAMRKLKSRFEETRAAMEAQMGSTIFGEKTSDLEMLQNIDAFCAALPDRLDDATVCGAQKKAKEGRGSLMAALALTPAVPLLLLGAGLILKIPEHKRNKIAKAVLWLILKSVNKILALKNVVLAYSISYSVNSIISIGAFIVGLVVWSIIFGMEAVTTEWFTKGKLTVEAKLEPEKEGAT